MSNFVCIRHQQSRTVPTQTEIKYHYCYVSFFILLSGDVTQQISTRRQTRNTCFPNIAWIMDADRRADHELTLVVGGLASRRRHEH